MTDKLKEVEDQFKALAQKMVKEKTPVIAEKPKDPADLMVPISTERGAEAARKDGVKPDNIVKAPLE